MAYNQTYEPNDFVGILTDVLGKFGVEFMSYIGIVILVGVLVWGVRKIKR